jgi:ribonuclease P/MRP protein subunit RPP40
MFITFVRPKVEYATVIWSPWHKKDINLVERVQRSFTCRIPGLLGPYNERLLTLNLQSLELRRIIFDLTEVYKIMHGLSELK